MLKAIDEFYLKQEEPNKSCLMALRDTIAGLDEKITQTWKYSMPFFCYEGKRFCYLWIDKKAVEPYIGIVDGNKIKHESLEQGDRSRMKILRIDAYEDLPIDLIKEILNQALDLVKKK